MMFTNGALPSIITFDSLKYPEERSTIVALRDRMAYAIVWQGEAVPQEEESTPAEGSTRTVTSAAAMPWRHAAHSIIAIVAGATTLARGFEVVGTALRFNLEKC
jgi:hypothetical protein